MVVIGMKRKSVLRELFQSENYSVGLVGPIPLNVREGVASQEFTVHQGESLTFFLEYLEIKNGDQLLSTPESGDKAFQNNLAFWQRWLSPCQYDGR